MSNSRRTSLKPISLLRRKDKIFFIDQHVAAERVLYERFVNQMQADGIPVQGLLLPVTLEATPQQLGALKIHGDIFEKLGFDLEEFGGNTILIRAIPSPLPTRAAAQTVTDLLDKLPEAAAYRCTTPGSHRQRLDHTRMQIGCQSRRYIGYQGDDEPHQGVIASKTPVQLPALPSDHRRNGAR